MTDHQWVPYQIASPIVIAAQNKLDRLAAALQKKPNDRRIIRAHDHATRVAAAANAAHAAVLAPAKHCALCGCDVKQPRAALPCPAAVTEEAPVNG